MNLIIEGNTKAMTTLADRLLGKISNCPLGQDPVLSSWLHVWMQHSIEEHQRKNPPEPQD